MGVENIPQSGPAIIVLYHATVPIDAGFFLAEVNLQTNRKLLMIVDRMAFKIPGKCELCHGLLILGRTYFIYKHRL